MSSASGQRNARGPRAAIFGLLVNVGLAIVKLLSGLYGHSYALVADAVESLGDIFGSIVVWGGLRIAARPADEDHPYGHGKAEALAALFVALLLFAAAAGIAAESVREIVRPHHAPAPFTLWVLLGVVAIKESMFRIVRGVAQTEHSGAVLADAWHHRSDALTSAAAAVGISIALIGGAGYESADDWAALFASAVIIFNAARLIRAPLGELMDAEPVEIVAEARTLATTVAGVSAVEKVFARKSGTSFWIDMHIEVDPAMTVRRSHGVAHEVKNTICSAMPAVRSVLVHIEPHETDEN